MRLLFRVAMALGRTVEELVATMSAAEWRGWCAFYACEPFGPLHDDRRAAGLRAGLFHARGVKADPAAFAESSPPQAKPAKPAAIATGQGDALLAYIAAHCPALGGR